MYWASSKHVSGDDFADPRLGLVWDGIGTWLAQGRMVATATAPDFFADWGVLGLSVADPWLWSDAAQGVYLYAEDYARSVARTAATRFGKEVLAQGLDALKDPGNDPERVIGDVVMRVQDRATSGANELDSVSLREILSAEETYDWCIPDLMERKDRLILTGHEGLGKSTMARQMLLLPAAGLHPFTFEKIEPVKCLVIDAENTAKQWKRNAGHLAHQAKLQGGHDPADRVDMAISGRVNILDPRTQGQIHRLIDKSKPDIVFIGPLYRIAVKLNSDDEVAPVIAALDSIRDRGVALIMEAHAGHANDPSGSRSVRPRGSSALMGWPEFGFGIRASDEQGMYDFVPWRGQREQRSWPEVMRRGDPRQAEFPFVPVSGYAA
jgi:replicative DNA helicase